MNALFRKQSERRSIMFAAFDAALVAALSLLLYFVIPAEMQGGADTRMLMAVPTITSLFLVLYLCGWYKTGTESAMRVSPQRLAVAAGLGIGFGALSLADDGRSSLAGVLLALALPAGYLLFPTVWRLTFASPQAPGTLSTLLQPQILVVGAAAERFADGLREASADAFGIAGTLALPDAAAGEGISFRTANAVALKAEGMRASTIVFALDPPARAPWTMLLQLRLRGFQVAEADDFIEQQSGRVDVARFDPGVLMRKRSLCTSTLKSIEKRLLDIVVSLTLLVLLGPLMLVVALLVKLTSDGPVIYWQKRIGLGGRPFWMLKFRSMRCNAEANGVARWATVDDPRVTPIGRLLRSTRLDELPQLVNILKGEMSFVGPRPERPEFVEQLQDDIPQYYLRHFIKPGLTGWAQINFSYGASIEDARRKLAYDLFYLSNAGLLLDLFIIARTVRVVLLREGGR